MEIRHTQPSFGSGITVIDPLVKKASAAHMSNLKNEPICFGPLNYLKYMDAFYKRLNELNPRVKAKNLDISITGNDKGIKNPYEVGFYDINAYVLGNDTPIITVNPIDINYSSYVGRPIGSPSSCKSCIDSLFCAIRDHINVNK